MNYACYPAVSGRQALRMTAPGLPADARRLFLADDDDGNAGRDVGVQMQFDRIAADVAERAGLHAHFMALEREAARGRRFGDVRRADRAEQLAFGAGLGGDGDALVVQLSGTGLGRGQALALGLFHFSATLFERGQIGLGGGHGLALRQQVVAGIAAAYRHAVAELAQVLHFFQQDDVHHVVLVLIKITFIRTDAVTTPLLIHANAESSKELFQPFRRRRRAARSFFAGGRENPPSCRRKPASRAAARAAATRTRQARRCPPATPCAPPSWPPLRAADRGRAADRPRPRR